MAYNFDSQFDIDQVVNYEISGFSMRATIRAVHFYRGKVKYDLDIWTGEGINETTRIYNVDSCFVVPYE